LLAKGLNYHTADVFRLNNISISLSKLFNLDIRLVNPIKSQQALKKATLEVSHPDHATFTLHGWHWVVMNTKD
jgi:hypothetical protein